MFVVYKNYTAFEKPCGGKGEELEGCKEGKCHSSDLIIIYLTCILKHHTVAYPTVIYS